MTFSSLAFPPFSFKPLMLLPLAFPFRTFTLSLFSFEPLTLPLLPFPFRTFTFSLLSFHPLSLTPLPFLFHALTLVLPFYPLTFSFKPLSLLFLPFSLNSLLFRFWSVRMRLPITMMKSNHWLGSQSNRHGYRACHSQRHDATHRDSYRFSKNILHKKNHSFTGTYWQINDAIYDAHDDDDANAAVEAGNGDEDVNDTTNNASQK